MNKSKSGAQKRREKLVRDLQSAASEPKQKKLCFSPLSARSESPDQSQIQTTPSVEDCNEYDGDIDNNVAVDKLNESETPQEIEENDTAVLSHSRGKSETPWPFTSEGKLKLLTTPPYQPIDGIPFQRDIYFQNVKDDQRIQRRWLTYDSVEKKLYCRICGCFSANRSGDLVCGLGGDNFRRASITVKRHESSQHHRDASDVYFRHLQGKDIVSLTPQWMQVAKRSSREKVEQNRQVLNRVIDIIKLIASQGLAYRGGGCSESARYLRDASKRHGNFLELVLLLCKYDPTLNAHVDNCVEQSKKQGKGRGSFVTFISKTTVNNILVTLAELIQEEIVKCINTDCRGKYGAMMDGTVDISGTDQMSVVVRFVTSDGKVQERLLGLDVITSGKGEALWKLLSAKLQKHNLNIQNLIGLSLDGTSANTSDNVGVVKYYKDSVPLGYFVWGFAHQQNLVVAPVFSEIKECRNLLGLLQETCTFFNESSRRMDVWKRWVEKHSKGAKKLKKLVKVGKTRWWSSFKAVKRICDEPTSYYILLGTLWELSIAAGSSDKTRNQSDALLRNWLSFKSLITAIIIKNVVKTCDPVTKYLQTIGLDITQALRLVEHEMNILAADRSKFEQNFQCAKEFRQQVQQLIDDDENADFDIVLEENLPTSAISRKKRRFFDEQGIDAPVTDPFENFRINVYLPVIDCLTQEISSRFNEVNSALYKEIWYLNPSSYDHVVDATSFSISTLAELSDVDEIELKDELTHFARVHKESSPSDDNRQKDDSTESDEEEEEQRSVNPVFCKGDCSSCLGCTLQKLITYRNHCSSYNTLYQCLRTALTLPCTVVSCERTFSKLRFIKNRLRSLLSQHHLEAVMICSAEVDLLKAVDNEAVYQKLASNSSQMEHLLMF